MQSPVSYGVDSNDCLTDFNDAWTSFAAENADRDLTASSLVGRSLWDEISDVTTGHLYRLMFQRLRQGAPVIQFRFRCDGPAQRRLLSMEMKANADGCIRFEVTPLVVENRDPIPLMEAQPIESEWILDMCSWCNRIEVEGGRWVEIETGLEAHAVFEGQATPSLTHGICAACEAAVFGMLDGPDEDLAGTVTLGPWLPA